MGFCVKNSFYIETLCLYFYAFYRETWCLGFFILKEEICGAYFFCGMSFIKHDVHVRGFYFDSRDAWTDLFRSQESARTEWLSNRYPTGIQPASYRHAPVIQPSSNRPSSNRIDYIMQFTDPLLPYVKLSIWSVPVWFLSCTSTEMHFFYFHFLWLIVYKMFLFHTQVKL